MFTAAERDLIRRELGMRFGQLPSVADGLFLRSWRGGAQAGQPKLPATMQNMLEQSLVEVRTDDRFLMSGRTPDDRIGLSNLNDFLIGILIGPELVLPSEWLPHVWGGGALTFGSAEEAQALHSALLGHCNAIARALDSDQSDDLSPICWVQEEDAVFAGDWAEGFLDAMRLHPDAWAPLAQDKDARLRLVPVFTSCGNEANESLLPLI